MFLSFFYQQPPETIDSPFLLLFYFSGLGSPEQFLPDTRKVTNMIHLQLLNETTAERRDKKVPKRINLHTLQNLIVKLFGLPDSTSSLRLYLLDRKRKVRIPLENHGKSLDFYSVEDNDTIVFE